MCYLTCPLILVVAYGAGNTEHRCISKETYITDQVQIYIIDSIRCTVYVYYIIRHQHACNITKYGST